MTVNELLVHERPLQDKLKETILLRENTVPVQQLRRTELGLAAISPVTRRLNEKLLNKILLSCQSLRLSLDWDLKALFEHAGSHFLIKSFEVKPYFHLKLMAKFSLTFLERGCKAFV